MRIDARLRHYRDRALGRMDLDYYRSLGMQIGIDVSLGPDCRLDPSTAWMVTIGDDVVFGPGVEVLAHDACLRRRIGYTKIQHTFIGSHVFIGAKTTILPGVSIGDDVVVGAGSLVTRNIPANSLAYGHPAQVVMALDEFEVRERALLAAGPHYNEATPGRPLTMDERAQMRNDIKPDGLGWGS
jgi:maltose O-acetyltransferase